VSIPFPVPCLFPNHWIVALCLWVHLHGRYGRTDAAHLRCRHYPRLVHPRPI
jgi:hypothetical protein